MSLNELNQNIPLYSLFEYCILPSEQKIPQFDAISVLLPEDFPQINKNFFDDNLILETNDSNEEKKIIGKKRPFHCEKNKKIHTKYEIDNVLRTIQVHYSNKFIINFINEILYFFGIEGKFYNIDYKYIKNIKKDKFKNLKAGNIGTFLCQKISPKFKKIDKDNNINLYKKLIKNDIINKILSENYIKLFKEIYFQNKREINYCGLKITLSTKVKTFNDFLNNEKYDKQYREKIIKAVENNYLKKPKKPHFIIKIKKV